MAYVRVNQPTIKQYRRDKIEMLKRDMKIKLTPEQKLHFGELTTEIQIDNYARKVINDAWGE